MNTYSYLLKDDFRRAFTLIELLVVISIIALLSTLTLVGLKTVRGMINDVSTTNRIEGVLTGLAQLGAGTNDTSGFIIQRDIGLKGVLTFRPSKARALNGDEWVLNNQVVSQSAGGSTLTGTLGATMVTLTGQMVPEGIAEKDRSSNVGVSGQIFWNDYWKNIKTSGGLPVDPGKGYADAGKRYAWLGDDDYAYTAINVPKTTVKLDQGSYPYLPFPWGKARPIELLSRVEKLNGSTSSNVVDEFMLRWCDVSKTRELLWLSGIAPRDLTATSLEKQFSGYMTDRSKKAAWNDAWGNPLVAAYAMYQPPGQLPGSLSSFNKNNETTFVVPALGSSFKYTYDMANYGSVAVSGIGSFSAYINRQDHIFNICRNRYHADRIIYVAVAAAGLTIPEIDSEKLVSEVESDWTGTSGVLYKIWKRVAVGDPDGSVKPVCQQGVWKTINGGKNTTVKGWIYDSTQPEEGKGEWMSASWDNPPWQGINKQNYTDPTTGIKYHSFLSAPVVFK